MLWELDSLKGKRRSQIYFEKCGGALVLSLWHKVKWYHFCSLSSFCLHLDCIINTIHQFIRKKKNTPIQMQQRLVSRNMFSTYHMQILTLHVHLLKTAPWSNLFNIYINPFISNLQTWIFMITSLKRKKESIYFFFK